MALAACCMCFAVQCTACWPCCHQPLPLEAVAWHLQTDVLQQCACTRHAHSRPESLLLLNIGQLPARLLVLQQIVSGVRQAAC